MSQPFVGECRLVGFNFAPAGWAMCQGALMPISEFETLFNLIGTTYGGDGQSTFALPDLQGRAAVHLGPGFVVAQTGGAETVTVTLQQIPIHNHPLMATSVNGTANNFVGSVLAGCPTPVYVANPTPNKAMNGSAVTLTGGSQPHNNLQPYLTMSWIIALFGIYPSAT
jgi:microcystin-dependent protein